MMITPRVRHFLRNRADSAPMLTSWISWTLWSASLAGEVTADLIALAASALDGVTERGRN